MKPLTRRDLAVIDDLLTQRIVALGAARRRAGMDKDDGGYDHVYGPGESAELKLLRAKIRRRMRQ